MVNRRLFELGLQSAIAHNIAQNLNANSEFNITEYVEECWQLFVAAGMDEVFLKDIFEIAIDQAKLEYAMGIVHLYGSAQLTPAASYEYAIEQYKRLTVIV